MMPLESETVTRIGRRTQPKVILRLEWMEAVWARIAGRRILSCLLVVASCLVLRLALLKLDPIPEPKEQDEFSYILAGETLAAGRLANPTPPMWRFFETTHVNMQPTYVSKYPPGQALFLALGIRLFGHPWYGVLLSVALMCGAVCWMLQGWLPAKYALLGGMLAVLQFGLTHYWVDSYWGGAVAATGGALVFGALPRLARRAKGSVACVAATGIAILAYSRPFEGLCFVALVSAALVWSTRRQLRTWLRASILLPFAVIGFGIVASMAYYNLKTTGSPTKMPYTVNQERYSASPHLWIMPPYKPRQRQYRDASMRQLWESFDLGVYARARQNPIRSVFYMYEQLNALMGNGAGESLKFLIACALPFIAIPRLRMALGALTLFLAVLLLDKFIFPHYLAPAVGAIFVVAMFGVRLLRCSELAGKKIGLPLVMSVVALAGVFSMFGSALTIYNHSLHLTDAIEFRNQVSARLQSEPGKHLVLVHYAPDHDVHKELVYNGPDINSQKVIWAFDFGSDADRPLLDYYLDRRVWLVQPDGPNPTLQPYRPDRQQTSR